MRSFFQLAVIIKCLLVSASFSPLFGRDVCGIYTNFLTGNLQVETPSSQKHEHGSAHVQALFIFRSPPAVLFEISLIHPFPFDSKAIWAHPHIVQKQREMCPISTNRYASTPIITPFRIVGVIASVPHVLPRGVSSLGFVITETVTDVGFFKSGTAAAPRHSSSQISSTYNFFSATDADSFYPKSPFIANHCQFTKLFPFCEVH